MSNMKKNLQNASKEYQDLETLLDCYIGRKDDPID